MAIGTTKLKTAPTSTALTVNEAMAHCRVVDAGEGAYISDLIYAATGIVEARLRRKLITQTWYYYLNRFPCGPIALPFPPVTSVTGITYTDSAGAAQTLTVTTDYEVHVETEPAIIVPAYGQTWPSTYAMPNVVRVEYVCGYGASTAVPQDVRHALKLLVGHFYEHREAVITGTIVAEMDLAVDALLSGHVHGWEAS